MTETRIKTATRVLGYLREALAIIFWLYLMVTVFVYPIDNLLIEKIPSQFAWMVQYKFFVAIGILALIWLFTKSKYIYIWFLYIIFYPFILFAEIFYFIFKRKSWNFAFAIANALISFFKSLKYNFITAAIFLLSLFCIAVSSTKILLIPSIICLIIVLILVYIRSFISVFRPSGVFQLYKKLSEKTPGFIMKFSIKSDVAKNSQITDLTDPQRDILRSNLQLHVLGNRGLLFLARKLRDYQDSQLNIISYTISIFILILLLLISFASISTALFKLDPSSYSVSVVPGYFTFFYYAFHTMFFSSIQEIIPRTFYPQLSSMIEQVFEIFIAFIILSLFFNTKNERYRKALSQTIDDMTDTGQKIEGAISTEYNMNIEQAIDEIGKLKNNLLNIILWLSK